MRLSQRRSIGHKNTKSHEKGNKIGWKPRWSAASRQFQLFFSSLFCGFCVCCGYSLCSSRQAGDGLAHAAGQVVHMFLGVALVPRQDQHSLQGGERTGEALGRIVDRLRPRQRERIPAAAKRALLAEDLTLKGGLLGVARRRSGAPLFQESPEPWRSAVNNTTVHAQAVFPPRRLRSFVHAGSLDTGQSAQCRRQSFGGLAATRDHALQLRQLRHRDGPLQLAQAIIESKEVVIWL